MHLTPDEAVQLGALALFLLALVWALIAVLEWRLTTLSKELPLHTSPVLNYDVRALIEIESAIVIVGSAWVLSRLIQTVHFFNIGFFLFAMSTWQPLGQWITRMLPAASNQVVLLFSYFLICAIIKITWPEIMRPLRAFRMPR